MHNCFMHAPCIFAMCRIYREVDIAVLYETSRLNDYRGLSPGLIPSDTGCIGYVYAGRSRVHTRARGFVA
jgi:hypothetical protein